MGLDMTLCKQHNVERNTYAPPSQWMATSVTMGGKPHDYIRPERIILVTERLMTWRKANAVHAFFDAHIAGGVANCTEHPVKRETLARLLERCERVIAASELVAGPVANGYTLNANGTRSYNVVPGLVVADPSIATALLPTADGYFFGSTDYDEVYLADIVATRDLLSAELSEPDTGATYTYSVSW